MRLSVKVVPARLMLALVLIASALSLAGCGGSGSGRGSSSPTSVSSTFTVGGAITGLGSAKGLVLANVLPNGSVDTLTVPADSVTFTMPTAIANGSAYDVTVKAHPTALQCNVISAAGTVDGANVTSISVSCGTGSESVLYSFVGSPVDGDGPGVLIQAIDGNLYGTTGQGGAANCGIAFKMTPSGTITPSDTETVLYSFSGGAADGCGPTSLIQASDGNLYGTTAGGGKVGPDGYYCGTVFKITPNGTNETVLYSFAGGTSDGCTPTSVIQARDGNLYGVTDTGGTSDDGAVFMLTPSGTETILYSFAGGRNGASGLIQGSDGNFYGTTSIGGIVGQCGDPSYNVGATAGNGAVFKITPNGTETVLHSFAGGATDGCQPRGLILASDGNFYGATLGGGASNDGVVYKITPSGTETILYSFAGGTTDGAWGSALIQASDGNFYGITSRGGRACASGYNNGDGVLFKLTPSGAETVVHFFASDTTDGCTPTSLIQGSDGTLYGTSAVGGTNNDGTIWGVN